MRNDINLIVKRKQLTTPVPIVSVLLATFFVAVFAGYFGYYLPSLEKKLLQEEIATTEEKLNSYGDVDQQYNDALQKVNNLKLIAEAFDNLKNNDIKVSEIIKDFEEKFPESVILKEFDLNEGVITLNGIASKYDDVARLILKLRELDYVNSVRLSFIDSNIFNDEESYEFNVTVFLNITGDTPDETAGAANEGGGTNEAL